LNSATVHLFRGQSYCRAFNEYLRGFSRMASNELAQGMEENTISLLFGHPDPSTLLPPELHNAMRRVISSPQCYTALQYGSEQGTPGLINFLVEKINREQDLSIQSGNMMVVAGSTHAVDMIARLF